MALTIRLTQPRRKKTSLRGIYRHELGRTFERGQFRRAPRRRHGEKKAHFSLVKLESQRGGPRSEKVEDETDIPRSIKFSLRRTRLEDAKHETRDEGMASYGVTVDRRKRRRKARHVQTNSPKRPPTGVERREIVQHHGQIDLIDRNSSGTEKVEEGPPDAVVALV